MVEKIRGDFIKLVDQLIWDNICMFAVAINAMAMNLMAITAMKNKCQIQILMNASTEKW